MYTYIYIYIYIYRGVDPVLKSAGTGNQFIYTYMYVYKMWPTGQTQIKNL